MMKEKNFHFYAKSFDMESLLELGTSLHESNSNKKSNIN